MKKSLALAIVLLLLPALSAGAASSLHRKHVVHHRAQKARPSEATPAAPPVTRLPVPPDTFRA